MYKARQARQGTSSGNAAIANFKIGRLSVCDMYIFSTGSQHVYPFFGHTNTLTATIGGNAATANFKIGRLSICDVYLLHRIAKCISFLLPYSYIGWHKQCQRSYLQFQNWTSFGLRPVCLLNRIAKRISFLATLLREPVSGFCWVPNDKQKPKCYIGCSVRPE